MVACWAFVVNLLSGADGACCVFIVLDSRDALEDGEALCYRHWLRQPAEVTSKRCEMQIDSHFAAYLWIRRMDELLTLGNAREVSAAAQLREYCSCSIRIRLVWLSYMTAYGG